MTKKILVILMLISGTFGINFLTFPPRLGAQSIVDQYKRKLSCTRASANFINFEKNRFYCLFGNALYAAVDDASRGGFVGRLDRQSNQFGDIDPLTLSRRFSAVSEVFVLEGLFIYRYSCSGFYGDCDLGSLSREFLAGERYWAEEKRRQEAERRRQEAERRRQEELRRQQHFEENLDQLFR